MKLSRRFRQFSEERGIALRHQLGLQAFDPLPARQLARELKVELFSPQQLGEGLSAESLADLLASDAWSAITVTTEPPMVLYHPLHAPTRFESNVMHELAHLVLGHRPENLTSWSILYTGRTYSARQEDEAAYLGACLQVTRVGIDWANGEGLCLCQAAEHFVASWDMMRFRLNASCRNLVRCDQCRR